MSDESIADLVSETIKRAGVQHVKDLFLELESDTIRRITMRARVKCSVLADLMEEAIEQKVAAAAPYDGPVDLDEFVYDLPEVVAGVRMWQDPETGAIVSQVCVEGDR